MREPYLGVAVGKKGSGKTFITERMIREYVAGNQARGIPPRRALIMDVNDEFSHIKAMSVEHVVRFSMHRTIEARRIRPFRPDGVRMTLDEIAATLWRVLESYRGGLLLVEDINRYVGDNLPQDLIGALCTNRHTDTDIIMHYQGIGRLVPKIWQNLNWLRFHKNTERVDRHRLKFEDKYEYLKIVELMMDHEYYDNNNKHFYVFVDIDAEKIVGNFSQSTLEYAIDKYISTQHKKVVKPAMDEITLDGKKKYTAAEAVAEVKRRLYENYTHLAAPA